jgi:hypothetical protein
MTTPRQITPLEAAGVSHLLQQGGDLERPRAAEDLDVVVGGARASERVQRALGQLVDHEVVEARGDDREPFAVGAQASFVDLGHQPFSPRNGTTTPGGRLGMHSRTWMP